MAKGEGNEASQPLTTKKPRIYASGKMMFFNSRNRDWRGLAHYKELEWTQGEPLLDKLKELRDLELEFGDWIYVGPHFLTCPALDNEVDYFYQLDDEPRSGPALAAFLREEQRDFTVDEREKQTLYENIRHQIRKCDVLYARLTDEKDCFWTLTEIGIAAALGKRVYIDCPVQSHDTWLLPLLSEDTKGTRAEYVTIPWALYK